MVRFIEQTLKFGTIGLMTLVCVTYQSADFDGSDMVDRIDDKF